MLRRADDNREKVATLLNLTDGMLGDALGLQVVCTLNSDLTGPFIVLTMSGLVFGATGVQATPLDVVVHWMGLEHRLHLDDIEIVYEVDPHHPAAIIDPGILSRLIALERLVLDFARERPGPIMTLFCSGSLALTLVPDRTTNDLDVIAADEFASFVNRRSIETDLEIGLLDERLLRLLGPWACRTGELRGPMGVRFRLVHPLDAMMQKLLRYSEVRIVEKDQRDIDVVMQKLLPSQETLLLLLSWLPGSAGRFRSMLWFDLGPGFVCAAPRRRPPHSPPSQ